MLSVFIRPVASVKLTTLYQSRKSQKPSIISAKRLDFSRKFDRRKNFSSAIKIKNPNLMKGFDMVGHAGISDEGFKAFDQESLVPGSLNVESGGLESNINNLSKWIVSATVIALVLLRHDPEALWACIGSVLNTMLSVALKKILNQERPVSTLRSDPGMPSSHAQSIFYTFIFLSWSLVEWYGVNGFTITLSGLFFMVSSYFSWLRVSQQLHTVSQIVVGAILGSIFAIFWFWAWNKFVFDLFISSLWMRVAIIVGAVLFSFGFLRHVFRSWIPGER